MPVDCASVIRKVMLNLQAHRAERRVVTWTLAAVHAHEIRMVQLFQNLIGNAIKYRGEEAAADPCRGATGGNGTGFLRGRQRHRNQAGIRPADFRYFQAAAWTKLSGNRHRPGDLPADRGTIWRPDLGGVRGKRVVLLLHATAGPEPGASGAGCHRDSARVVNCR